MNESVSDAPVEFAGLIVRFLALAVDLLLLSCVFFPVTRIVKGKWLLSASDHQWSQGWLVTDPLCLAFLVVMFLYFVLFEALMYGTPGKRILRLRVVALGGARAGLQKSLVRNVLRVVDGLPAFGILGAVLILRSEDRARVGDRVAGTRVIRIRRASGSLQEPASPQAS
jgi:uncharacterized RDD family membrane protein YckC